VCELIHGSETSANYNLTPGKYPEENIQDSTPVSSSKLLGECSINPLKTKINPGYIKQSDYTTQ